MVSLHYSFDGSFLKGQISGKISVRETISQGQSLKETWVDYSMIMVSSAPEAGSIWSIWKADA